MRGERTVSQKESGFPLRRELFHCHTSRRQGVVCSRRRDIRLVGHTSEGYDTIHALTHRPLESSHSQDPEYPKHLQQANSRQSVLVCRMDSPGVNTDVVAAFATEKTDEMRGRSIGDKKQRMISNALMTTVSMP